MKKTNIYLSIFTFLVTLAVPVTALANSSWCWLTDVRPIYIFPITAVLTIAIETAMINCFAKINNIGKTLLAVIIANLFSFACPYISYLFTTPLYTLDQFINNTPSYVVTSVFVIITLVAEIPVVFLILRKNCKSKSALFISIFTSNVLTTAMVALIERLVCKGVYF